MNGRKVTDSSIEAYTYQIFPNDLNSLGTVLGGLVLSLIDRLALVVAERHSGHNCVTTSVDAINFLATAGRDDTLIFSIAINRTWDATMEIGAKVMTENSAGIKKHLVSAYLTFIALDAQKKPIEVPPVLPETAIEKRRHEEAERRSLERKKEIENPCLRSF